MEKEYYIIKMVMLLMKAILQIINIKVKNKKMNFVKLKKSNIKLK